jgi:hypothetical protein
MALPLMLGLGGVGATHGDIGAVIDSLEFDGDYGDYPAQIVVGQGMVACVYTGPDSDGWIATYEVDKDGVVGSVIDTLEYDAAQGTEASVLGISGATKYIVASYGTSGVGKIYTVDISTAGVIGDSVIDSHQFDTVGSWPSICWVSGDVYAISYTGPDADGWLKTIDVNSDGTIDASPEIDSWEWDTVSCGRSVIVKRSGTVYIIAQQDPVDDRVEMFSLSIANDGTITESKTDTFNSATPGEKGHFLFCQVTGDVYAGVVPWDSVGAGNPAHYFARLFTFTVTTAGAISDDWMDAIYLEEIPRVSTVDITVSDDADFVVCAVNYSSTNISKRIYTADVDGSGNIGGTLDSLTIESVAGKLDVVHVSGGICAIAGQTTDDDCKAWSFDIEETIVRISCSPSSHGFGTVVTNAGYSTGADYFTITNSGNVAVDITIRGTDLTGIGPTTWTLSDTAEVASGQCGLRASNNDASIGGTLDTLEFDTDRGQYVDVCGVAANVLAVAYCGTDYDGFVKTVGFDCDGDVGAVIDTLEFYELDAASYMTILQHPGDATTHIIAHQAGASTGRVTTVDIASDGTIADSVIDYWQFEAVAASDVRMFWINGDVFGLVYRGVDQDGYLRTFDVNSDGTIDGSPELDSWEFDADEGDWFSVPQFVGGTYYAMSYSSSSEEDGTLVTFDIATDGTITESFTDSLEFQDATDGGGTKTVAYTDLASIRGNYWGIVYRYYVDGTASGILKTVDIGSDGTIGTVADTETFDADVGGNNDMRALGIQEIGAAVFYGDGGATGYMLTYGVSDAGVIGAQTDSLNFNATNTQYLAPYEIGDGILVVGYCGVDYDGFLETIDIGYDVIVKKSASYNTLVSNLVASGTQDWGLLLLTPTAALGGVQVSGTITLTATEHV